MGGVALESSPVDMISSPESVMHNPESVHACVVLLSGPLCFIIDDWNGLLLVVVVEGVVDIVDGFTLELEVSEDDDSN